jgi:hypothetical protein
MEDLLINNYFLPIINVKDMNNTVSNLFCMSIPPNNKIECFRKLSLLALGLNIKKLICLDESIVDIEKKCWEFFNYLEDIPTNTNDFNDFLIKDMTPGILTIYYKFINQIQEIYLNNNTTCVHCLAGFGRTGSMVLLYLLTIYFINNQYDVSIHHNLNYYINILFNHVGNRNMISEFFNNRDIFYTYLLIKRLNLINLTIALSYNENNVILYSLHPNNINNLDLTEYELIILDYTNLKTIIPNLCPKFITNDNLIMI